jgi:2-dehydro-3-deoxygalactonokinase
VSPPLRPAIVAVDWGTSSLRIWLMDDAGAVMAERRSAEGMEAVGPLGFEGVLRARLADIGIDPDAGANRGCPIIMCGMVGARQGWCEAPYMDVPVELARIADGAIAVRCGVMDVRILPGLCRRDPARPDVMRGEETQLLGLLADEQPGVVLIPGTHSKWVTLAGATVTDFRTVMTGEIYALLCRHSVLRHTIAAPDDVAPTADFAAGVRAGLDEPAAVLASAFAVRAGGLLFGRAGREAAAWLSGLLIGAEVGAALARAADAEVTILGAGALAGLYDDAVTAAGRRSRVRDGEAAARTGLRAAARRLWPAQLAGS